MVWCAGLPKSGTTLIEEILEYYAVSAKKSLLRLYDDSGLDHAHGISEKLFSSFPKNKITYLKTHSHFSKNYIDIATKHNSKILISMRDIRDAMISRYYHIMNDKNSWQHNSIKNLNFNDGFIKSISEFDNDFEISYTPSSIAFFELFTSLSKIFSISLKLLYFI